MEKKFPAEENEFHFVIHVEARRRYHVEKPIRAVAVLTGKTAALDFEIRYIFRVDSGATLAAIFVFTTGIPSISQFT